MQLKNNPLAMEKRTDLASLFCMIGRHGPAVAVAVIAMMSVVAGFIIYRTVKGKRRKAAAGDGDGDSRSRAALTDEALLASESEPEPEETRSRVESTDLSEEDLLDMKVTNVTRSPCNLRNRRAAAEKNATSNCPREELEPGNGLGASHVLDSSIVAEMCAEAACTVEDVCQLNLPNETSKDAEGVRGTCSMPVSSAGHENEEVPKAHEVEVTAKDVMDEKIRPEEENKWVSNSPVCPKNTEANPNQDNAPQENQTTPETVNMISSLEEPLICMDDVTISSNDGKIKEIPHPGHVKSSAGNSCITLESEVASVPQKVNAQDQQMTLDDKTGYSTLEQTKMPSSLQGHCEDMIGETTSDVWIHDADCSPFGKVTEKDAGKDHLKSLCTVSPVTLAYRKQELKSDHENDPLCNQEGVPSATLSSSEECDSSSGMLNNTLLCLNQSAETESTHDGLCSTKNNFYGSAPVCLQQEKEIENAVSPELAKDAGHDSPTFDLGNLQSEKKETGTDVVSPDVVLDNLLSSSCRDPDSAVCKKPAEMICSDKPPFQNQESEQVQIASLLEVATVPAPDMAESIQQMCQGQLLSFDQSELTWASSGVGEESGISSMTVSPDLPDTESDISVTDQYPELEEHVDAQSHFIADKAQFVSNYSTAETVPESCQLHLSQQTHSEHTEASCKLSPANEDTFGHEIEESCKQRADQLTAHIVTSDACLMNELRNETDLKAVVGEDEQKEGTKEDKMTEISIMEATMDTNEWITDGNQEVLPWMNLSKSTLPHNTQTGPVSSDHHLSSVPVDAPCKNADPLSLTEVKQASIIDEGKGGDKKVVAVQPMPQNVNVTFRIHYLTHSPYQKVAITGNQQELGNWKNFLPLEKAKDGHWSTVVNLPAESHVEWKFVVVDQGEVCRWEECGNRLLDTGYAEDLVVHKWWGFL
ncbi:uncharacterized protein stbd1 [Kryptolebias marmoratus]|uniref:Starch-binding domain-containing protein 1 n=1 Tax=Kryptolebias marmoratus TaxID=37003 RepID=A0A3Q3AWT1_KRYMA|nr:uncharacterized protein stbd1 [Kryptolebias marmoratus]